MTGTLRVISYDYSGKRRWLRPRWYMAEVHGPGSFMCGPYPVKAEVRPVPDPERICTECGADQTAGDGYALAEGFRCAECADLLGLPERGRLSKIRASLIPHNAYWRWCEKFGKRIMQEL